MILGHVNSAVLQATSKALESGFCFGATSEGEIELARLIIDAFPGMEKIRFVNSGTEAIMSAIRLARGFTSRNLIIKMAGCYHGHTDALLAEAGSGLATFGLPGSAGVTEGVVHDTLIAPYNDLDAVETILKKFPEQVAALLIEPVCGNMGVVLPEAGYLEGLRKLTQQFGTLLVFDEVMTGFRNNFGGIEKSIGVVPDITVLGKVIGGGMPVGAYGARKEIMEMVSPLGPVYQAGTLSGNPIAMACGIATLTQLQREGFYEELLSKSIALEEGMLNIAKQLGIALQVNRYGSMITPFFTDQPVRDYSSAKLSDTVKFAQFFWAMTDAGVYIPPSQFEAWFISNAHTQTDIEATLNKIKAALTSI